MEVRWAELGEMHIGTANTFIRAAEDGKIWVAGRQLLSYDGSSWVEHLYPPDTIGEEGLDIYGFIVDMQDNIWLTVGSTDRFPILYKYDGNIWQDFEIADESNLGIYLGEMWADPIAGIWYVSDRRSPGFDVHLTHFVNEEQLNTQSVRFPALLAKSIWGFEALPDGSFWYGSRGHTKWGNTPPGIYHYSGSLWERLILPASIPDNSIRSCARTNDGRLWFGTDYGLAGFDGQRWEVLTGGAGLPDTISLLVPITNNMLWISDSYGLTHFGLETRQFRGELFSLPAITSMATQNGRTLWLGGHDGTVWYFNGQEFINFPIPFQEGYFRLEALTVAPDDRVWVGYSNGNIFELGDDGWQNIASDDFSSVSVMNFADDKLWTVITREESNTPSIYSYDGTSWQSHRNTVFNIDEKVTTILNASDGTVWLGTDDGLIEYSPSSDSAKRLTTEDGLVDNAVTALCEGRKGSIWIGARAGLSRYEP